MDFKYGLLYGAVKSAIANWVLTLNGTNYAVLSEPKIFAGGFELYVTYNTTTTGVVYNITNEISVSAGNAFVTPVGITDILVDGISVGLAGPAPNDGSDHLVTFIGSNA